jgi:hypothetical protein
MPPSVNAPATPAHVSIFSSILAGVDAFANVTAPIVENFEPSEAAATNSALEDLNVALAAVKAIFKL